MNVLGGLTPGTMLFLAGAVVLAAAVVMSLVAAVTRKSRKRKMDDRMKEKY